MSLHIGNLSFHTRKDELERVFRRFGHCEVRIKDGYGFVVYDFPAAAERALKTLHGRKVCGEQLTLTWSKKQPKPYRRLSERSRDQPHGLNSSRQRIDRRKERLGLNGQEDFKVSVENVESIDGRPNIADIMDEEKGYNQENIIGCVREDHDDYNDRAGVQLNVSANESFERYKPDQGYENETDEAENHKMAFSGGSLARERSLEKTRKGYDRVSHNACFKCGGFGHKMRNCPTKNANREKYTRLDTRGENRYENDKSRRDRDEYRSQVIQPSSKNAEKRQLGRNKRTYDYSGKHGSLTESGSTRVDKEANGTREKGSDRKKRGNWEDRSPRAQSAKKARRSLSSPLRSDKFGDRPHSASKSLRPYQRLKSSSSKSRFLSPTSQSNPQGKSCSSSPKSLSVSITLGLNPQKSLDNLSTPETGDFQVENGKSDEADVELEKDKHESPKLDIDDQTIAASPKHGEKMGKEQLLLTDITQNDEMGKSSDEATNQEIQNSDVATDEISPASPSSISHQMTGISPDELYMVLKHYGLEVPNENERHSMALETYFGSARIWPWDIIYYRRLKKGPISVENYSRRLAQNEEFGIVDKYIRSSSGWGESEHLDS